MTRPQAIVVAAAELAVVFLAPQAAHAHRMDITCKVESELKIVVGYEDDTPAEQAKVTLADAAGTVVAEATTDDRGVCTIPRPRAGTYTLIADDGSGHRGRIEVPVPQSESEIAEVQTAKRNRWLMGAAGLLGIGGLTFAAKKWLRAKPAT